MVKLRCLLRQSSWGPKAVCSSESFPNQEQPKHHLGTLSQICWSRIHSSVKVSWWLAHPSGPGMLWGKWAYLPAQAKLGWDNWVLGRDPEFKSIQENTGITISNCLYSILKYFINILEHVLSSEGPASEIALLRFQFGLHIHRYLVFSHVAVHKCIKQSMGGPRSARLETIDLSDE